MNKELEDVLHEEGLTASEEEAMFELFAKEDKAWRNLFQALSEHFMHRCEEGTCDDTYGNVIDALNAAGDVNNEIQDQQPPEDSE